MEDAAEIGAQLSSDILPDYYAIKAVNNSILDEALVSPRHFEYAWRNFESHDKETKARKNGTALHLALNEPSVFASSVEFYPEPTGGKDRRLAASHKGKLEREMRASNPRALLLWQKDFEAIQRHLDSMMARPEIMDVMVAANSAEHEHYWTREIVIGDEGRDTELYDLPHKLRADRYGNGFLVDIKTTNSAAPENHQWFKHCINMDYYRQVAFYADHLGIERAENVKFLVFEMEPPYSVVMYRMTEETMEYGRRRYRQALDYIDDYFRQFGKWEVDRPWPSYEYRFLDSQDGIESQLVPWANRD